MSKGSWRRPGTGYAEGWDRIFGNMSLETKIVDYFLGSCNSIGAQEEDYFGLTEDEIAKILEDAGVIMCEDCGWWVEEDETQDRVCHECVEEQG